MCIYLAGFGLNTARVILFSKDNKLARLRVMFRGLISGLTFRPKVRFVR